MFAAAIMATAITLPKSGLVTPGEIKAVTREVQYKRAQHILHEEHLQHVAHEAALKQAKAARATPVVHAVTVSTPSPGPVSDSGGSAPSGGTGFEACVEEHESTNNPSAVNPSSGAGGLYGFLPSTWSSLGYSGLPQDAPVSVQKQAFQKEYAEVGDSAWAGDGCA